MKFSLLKFNSFYLVAILTIGASASVYQPVLADPVPAGTIIDNVATGTFVDELDTNNTEQKAVSNIVRVTVVEVAGITITAAGITGNYFSGGTAYFDFVITNVGNDPTQFFIPGAPSAITGGNLSGLIQIIEYDPDGSGAVASVPITNITVPTTGAATGELLSSVPTANNGSVPSGGTLKIRVPVLVTAAVGSFIKVVIGDTPAIVTDNTTSVSYLQNQPYKAGNRDLYTVDNSDDTPGEAAGIPVNGDTIGHRQEASTEQRIKAIASPVVITGRVFEDINYGGGAGRDFVTAGGVIRRNARVEIYNAAGDYQGFATTDINGIYKFDSTNVTVFPPGDYQVRVVNSTVTSSRFGYVAGLLPVQTFRTDASTGTKLAEPNRVGGEKPNKIDAAANTTSQTLAALNTAMAEAQSVTLVKTSLSGMTGIDFGYNFDTVVNTNNDGQGSLRQFIINSNALANDGLNQVGQVAEKEVSIFMISDGLAHAGLASGLPNLLSSYGAAVINLTTALPNITDRDTVIDGATQTTNVGNTNSGAVGTGGTVGTDSISLPLFQLPEVEISGINVLSGGAVVQTKLTATGAGNQLKNTAANLHLFYSGNDSLIQDNLVGMQANGTIVTALDNSAYAIEAGAGSNIIVKHNYVRADESGIHANGSGPGLLLEFNEVDAPPTGQTSTFEGIQLIGTGDSYTVRNNLIKNMQGACAELASGGILTNTLLENNSCIHNGYLTPTGNSPATENVGIVAHTAGASKITISKSIITGTSGPGIVIMGSRGITITRNSIYGNGVEGVSGLGIDLDPIDRNPNSYTTPNGVTANNGTVSASLPNNDIDYPIITFATLNNGTLGVKGYVGSDSAGSTTFGGVKLEFFIADNNPANQDGEVVLGDGKTRPHSEGKTYIGFCTADANGLFGTTTAPCTFSNAGALGLTNATKITATATDANGNTSEFSPEPIANNPNLLLVKRITSINGGMTTVGGDNLGIYKDTVNPYDDNDITIPSAPVLSTDPPRDTDKWPMLSTFLLGGTNGGTIKPNSEMEYTIYFLSAGDAEARNVVLCDLIPGNQTFVPRAFNSLTQVPGGPQGIDRGILLFTNATTTTYTNANDGDSGRYYSPGEPLPNACKRSPTDSIPTNSNGAIVVNLGNVPNALTPGSPADSYGFIRFRVRVR